eukprot:m.433259 g.433259  ORF g.433259 m.433259 type:complete len:372 (+) comp17552_c0_seq1:43-1158(+)
MAEGGEGSGTPSTQRKQSMLGKIGAAIKSSPKVMRKALKNATKSLRAGKNSEHSALKGCQSNGWLYKDEDVRIGINYKVQYLGSVEVDFDPADQDANQESAQTAMRALRDHNKGGDKLPTMGLQLSMKHIVLRTKDGGSVVMRHSTTRVAYSTVDNDRPRTFAYVAVVKGTELALCHVFNTRSNKQGYEMTFVCAHAFDLNLRFWTANKAEAAREAAQSEKTDIQPDAAWQKRGSKPKSTMALAAAAASTSEEEASAPAAPAEKPTPVSPTRSEKAFFGAQGSKDPAVLAGEYFASLGINLVEAEDDEPDDAFTELAARRAGSLAVGVDAEVWDGDSVGVDDAGGGVGYMTVGPTFNFADDDDDAEFDDIS